MRDLRTDSALALGPRAAHIIPSLRRYRFVLERRPTRARTWPRSGVSPRGTNASNILRYAPEMGRAEGGHDAPNDPAAPALHVGAADLRPLQPAALATARPADSPA